MQLLKCANSTAACNTEALAAALQQMNGNQAGDPYKLAAALIKMVEKPNPPVHLFKGPEAFEIIG